MPFYQERLANGLQLIGETLPTSRSVAVGFFVRTGSRDEHGPESGVSHFLEHMIFKGTPHRTALQVNLDFDRIGANYNAYTSEEHTVYYAAILPEYLPKAVDILADILRPSLRDEDFETEKQVILEEIKMYEDQPGAMAWDYARKIYFQNHPLGNSVLGTSDSITALTAAQMRDYFNRRYVNSNIVVAAAGNFDWPSFVELMKQKTQQWPDAIPTKPSYGEHRGPGGVHAVSKEGSAQQHVLCIGSSAPAESDWRYVASTLAVAVGDDSGSRLYWDLVDPGKVEFAGCAVDQTYGCGFFGTTYSCDPETTKENLAVVQKILDDVQKNGITEAELFQAKNKIASRVVRGSERPMGRMRTLAGSWLFLEKYQDTDAELARFDAVSLSQIQEYLQHYPINETTVVGYGPLAAIS